MSSVSESAKVVIEHPASFLAANSSSLELITPILAALLRDTVLAIIAVSACLGSPYTEAKYPKRQDEQDEDELRKHVVLLSQLG